MISAQPFLISIIGDFLYREMEKKLLCMQEIGQASLLDPRYGLFAGEPYRPIRLNEQQRLAAISKCSVRGRRGRVATCP